MTRSKGGGNDSFLAIDRGSRISSLHCSVRARFVMSLFSSTALIIQRFRAADVRVS